MLDKLTKEFCDPYVGEKFTIAPGLEGVPEVLEAELIEVAAYPLSPARGWGQTEPNKRKRAPFSLIFRGPRDVALPQRMYRVSNEKLGVLDGLFLVPVGIDERGRYYEAAFN